MGTREELLETRAGGEHWLRREISSWVIEPGKSITLINVIVTKQQYLIEINKTIKNHIKVAHF